MKERTIKISLEKAQEWFNKGKELKEIALQAFAEEELKFNFKNITTLSDAAHALNLDYYKILNILEELEKISKATAAAFQLNIIRKALHINNLPSFSYSEIWFTNIYAAKIYTKEPLNLALSRDLIADIKIEGELYTLRNAEPNKAINPGLGTTSCWNIACMIASSGYLGCATKEIADHMGKHFGKVIFDSMYGDLINYEWM